MTLPQFVGYIRDQGFSAEEFFVVVRYFVYRRIEISTAKDLNCVIPTWKKAMKARKKWLEARGILDEENRPPTWILPFLL